MSFETIAWRDNKVIMLDQLRLPAEEVYLEFTTPEEVAKAIRTMVIRGAPAIGIAAAMGSALGALAIKETDPAAFLKAFDGVCEMLARTRPTAVNLFWALERMKGVVKKQASESLESCQQALIAEAKLIQEEDISHCKAMGAYGATLVPENATILTHCNAGALATGGYGTALGVVRGAVEAGKKVKVFADETRPYLQGARLTAWELNKDGIEVTLITDSMAGHFLRSGVIDLVVVGSDRTAANGDVANKIGTYSVAVLAKENGVPFYVAIPTTTLDMSLASGEEIPIEERPGEEVTTLCGESTVPEGVKARYVAFDITPNRYVTAIITERGIVKPPFREGLARIMAE